MLGQAADDASCTVESAEAQEIQSQKNASFKLSLRCVVCELRKRLGKKAQDEVALMTAGQRRCCKKAEFA